MLNPDQLDKMPLQTQGDNKAWKGRDQFKNWKRVPSRHRRRLSQKRRAKEREDSGSDKENVPEAPKRTSGVWKMKLVVDITPAMNNGVHRAIDEVTSTVTELFEALDSHKHSAKDTERVIESVTWALKGMDPHEEPPILRLVFDALPHAMRVFALLGRSFSVSQCWSSFDKSERSKEAARIAFGETPESLVAVVDFSMGLAVSMVARSSRLPSARGNEGSSARVAEVQLEEAPEAMSEAKSEEIAASKVLSEMAEVKLEEDEDKMVEPEVKVEETQVEVVEPEAEVAETEAEAVPKEETAEVLLPKLDTTGAIDQAENIPFVMLPMDLPSSLLGLPMDLNAPQLSPLGGFETFAKTHANKSRRLSVSTNVRQNPTLPSLQRSPLVETRNPVRRSLSFERLDTIEETTEPLPTRLSFALDNDSEESLEIVIDGEPLAAVSKIVYTPADLCSLRHERNTPSELLWLVELYVNLSRNSNDDYSSYSPGASDTSHANLGTSSYNPQPSSLYSDALGPTLPLCCPRVRCHGRCHCHHHEHRCCDHDEGFKYVQHFEPYMNHGWKKKCLKKE